MIQLFYRNVAQLAEMGSEYLKYPSLLVKIHLCNFIRLNLESCFRMKRELQREDYDGRSSWKTEKGALPI